MVFSMRAGALLGLLFCAVAWAGNALIGRAVVGSMPPVSLAFWRWVLALVLLLPFVYRDIWACREALMAHRGRLVLMAASGIAAFNTLLYVAAQGTSAINITLINTGLPVAVFVWLIVMVREWPTYRTVCGTLLSFAGVLVVLAQGDAGRLLGLHFNASDLVMVVAVIVWGLYTVMMRRWPVPVPGLVLLGALMLVGALLLLPFYLWELWLIGPPQLSMESFAAVAYVSIFASLLAHQTWNYGIRIMGPVVASLFSYLIPVFTALFGVWLLGEALLPYHLVGGLMSFAGLVVVIYEA